MFSRSNFCYFFKLGLLNVDWDVVYVLINKWFLLLPLNIRESLVVTIEFYFIIWGLYLPKSSWNLSSKSYIFYYVRILTKSIMDFFGWFCYFYIFFGLYLKRIFELYIKLPPWQVESFGDWNINEWLVDTSE
jgi:hypothetical protein